MHKNIDTNVGFADSELLAYERTNTDFYIQVRAWNGIRLQILFKEFAGFCDRGAGDLSDFVEETEPTAFFDNVISRVYENLPSDNPYRLYQLLDLDRQPVLEIVACGFDILQRNP